MGLMELVSHLMNAQLSVELLAVLVLMDLECAVS